MAGRDAVLNRAADSWQIVIPPREVFRREVSLWDAFQTSALIFDAWRLFSLVQRWPTSCFESVAMNAAEVKVARYLGGGIRKVRSFKWTRLHDPVLSGPSTYGPQQIRFEDCSSGKHSHIALGATQEDVDKIKSLIEAFIWCS